MDPLGDRELDELLTKWQAPHAPVKLEERLRRARRPAWWRWLLTGTIRVPVPVTLLAVVAFVITLVIAIGHSARRQTSGGQFRPVKQAQVRIIRSSYESDR